MEYFDLYDADRIPTGERIVRGEPIPAGRWLLGVYVCIFNRRGQLLIQQRQLTRPTSPGKWDLSAGGGVISGETTRVAAQRETLEEIGCRIDLTDELPAATTTSARGFTDYYIVHADPDINSLQLQEDEVAAVRWASLDDILEMIDSGEFVSYNKPFLAYLFFRRDHFDARYPRQNQP